MHNECAHMWQHCLATTGTPGQWQCTSRTISQTLRHKIQLEGPEIKSFYLISKLHGQSERNRYATWLFSLVNNHLRLCTCGFQVANHHQKSLYLLYDIMTQDQNLDIAGTIWFINFERTILGLHFQDISNRG